jgi:hypothetical protein
MTHGILPPPGAQNQGSHHSNKQVDPSANKYFASGVEEGGTAESK